jgi:hypothetical protein
MNIIWLVIDTIPDLPSFQIVVNRLLAHKPCRNRLWITIW